MGKCEVLGVLTVLRDSGDRRFLSYGEIHREMKAQGLDCSYVVAWRAVNGLFSDGFLEVRKEGTLLSRRLSFRLKKRMFHTSGMKKNYNAYGNKAERSCGVQKGGANPKRAPIAADGVDHG